MLAEKLTIHSGGLACEAGSLLDKAISVLQDGICIVDEKAILIYINSACQRLMGTNTGRQPIPGDCFFDFVPRERKARHQQFVEDALAGHHSVFEFPLYDGSAERWLRLEYYPIAGEQKTVCLRARDITESVALRKLVDEEQHNQQKRIIKATLKAEEKQRSQIGRELHDNVNQVLTTIKLYAELCLGNESTNKELLEQIVSRSNYCIEEIRCLSQKLSRPLIEERSLEELIGELVDSVRATQKTLVSYRTSGIKGKVLKQDVQKAIYRIAQEQLTNVLKYSEAAMVEVIVVQAENVVAMQIQDNGRGFVYDENNKSSGITNMISRAEAAGGKIEFHTAPGKGCTVTAEFPL